MRDRASFPRDVTLLLEAACDRGPPSIPLANGGPALTLTGRFDAARAYAGVRTILSVGYEVGLFDYLIVSAWFETDFEEISEAVIVEGALPSIIYAIPGLSFGVGAVARQLGQRDVDAAFRMRIGLHWYYVGFVGDFDYWPAIPGWTATLGMRLGI